MPKLNASGYRGIWGTDLNEQIAYEFGRAFARSTVKKGGTKILVGRDARKTGGQIFTAIAAACAAEHLTIEYAGILPTPSMLFLIRTLGYDGGVMITASHNPPVYNGLKFISTGGLFCNALEIEQIEACRIALTPEEKIYSPAPDTTSVVDNKKFRDLHIAQVVAGVDVTLIKSKKYKVLHDPINSAGAVIGRELLEQLGCEVIQINGEQNGAFAHMPEPLAENLSQIAQAVTTHGAAVGFAQDPDADRLVIVDEKGVVVFEEYTLSLGVKNILGKEKGDIVINMSASSTNETLATKNGGKTYRSKVGEANVVEMMREKNAIVGGEGGGGIIYPKINPARDSLVGMALTLELMARENKTVSELVASLPQYMMKKDKMTFVGDLQKLYTNLTSVFTGATINTLDGVRFDFPDSAWIHIRPSNTEPLLRIIGEAQTQNRIDELFATVGLTLKSL